MNRNSKAVNNPFASSISNSNTTSNGNGDNNTNILNNKTTTIKSNPPNKANIINNTKQNAPNTNNEALNNENYNNNNSNINPNLEVNNNSEKNNNLFLTNSILFNSSESQFNVNSFPQGINIFPFKNNIEFPFTNFKKDSIPRCCNDNCQAYINPYCIFNSSNNGNTWVCNLCYCENTTQESYYCELDAHTKIRKDINTRKELSNTSYEISSYSISENTNIKPRFCFILDVSKESVISGLLYYTITALKHILKNDLIPDYDRTSISIITYTYSNISVFKFKKNCTPENMKISSLGLFMEFKDLIVNEVNNNSTEKEKWFLPVPVKQLSVNIEDYKDEILLALDMLEKVALKNNNTNVNSSNTNTNSNGNIGNTNRSNTNTNNTNTINSNAKIRNLMLHSIDFGRFLLKNKSGKILLFNSQLLELGINKAFPKEEVAFGYHTNDYISFFARELCQDKITVSVFLTYKIYTHCVSLFPLTDYTNGKCYLYDHSFNSRDSSNFDILYFNLFNEIVNCIGWDCLLKIRVSDTWSANQIFTPLFYLNNAFILPSIQEKDNYMLKLTQKSSSDDEILNKNDDNSNNKLESIKNMISQTISNSTLLNNFNFNNLSNASNSKSNTNNMNSTNKTNKTKLNFVPIKAFSKFCFFQIALIYSDSTGARKIRIMNNYTNTTANSAKVLLSIKESTMFSFIVKETIFNLFDKYKLQLIIEYYNTSILEILSFNNNLLKRGTIAESLKNFLSYSLGLLKSELLTLNFKSDIDKVNKIRNYMIKESCENVIDYCYSRIYAVNTNYTDNNNSNNYVDCNNSVSGWLCNNSTVIPCNQKAIEDSDSSVFIIMCYSYILVLFKNKIENSTVKKLFGYDTLDDLMIDFYNNTEESGMYGKTEFSKKFLELVNYERSKCLVYKKIFIIDSIENPLIKKILVEDNLCKELSISLNDYYTKLLGR